MGGYIEESLAKDEKIMVRAKYHWVKWLEFYFFTLLFVPIIGFCGLFAWQSYQEQNSELAVVAIVVALMTAIYPFCLYLQLKMTEMACTNRRVIYKTGVVSVTTAEIKIDKIESIQINQTFWERLFGYGTICFSGTGTAKVEFFYVSKPWKVKPLIEEAIDDSLGNFAHKTRLSE